MTVLSAGNIRERLCHPELAKRLIITPILDPSAQLKNTDVSIDVRLGRAFVLPRPWSHSAMEDVSTALLQGPLVEQIVLDYGQPLVLHPHQFVLARTLEVVRLPSDLMAYVMGRSSWGRRGLTVATATAVHPGFYGPIALELKNVGEVPISLYTFDRVAQLVLHGVDAVANPPDTDPRQEVPGPDSPDSLEAQHESSERPILRAGAEGAERSATQASTVYQPDERNHPKTLPPQFSFGFVPGLGQVRDEATRKRIVTLSIQRRAATLASREAPPDSAATAPLLIRPRNAGT